jgi:orotate phosphoribosyltransferase
MEEQTGFDMIANLESTGALRKGHFKLSSGRHSDSYIQCSQLLRDPGMAVEAGRAIASREKDIDLVFCPALGAIVIGFTVALALDTEMVFAERVGEEMVLRRGFEIPSGSRVLLVEDVVTTGGSIMELARIVEEAGAMVAGLSCIVDRSGGLDIPYTVTSLIRLDVASWSPEECPMCEADIPVDAPGSRFSAW